MAVASNTLSDTLTPLLLTPDIVDERRVLQLARALYDPLALFPVVDGETRHFFNFTFMGGKRIQHPSPPQHNNPDTIPTEKSNTNDDDVIAGLVEKYSKMIGSVQDCFDSVMQKEAGMSQMEFSAECRSYWCGGILFILYKQPFHSAREYFALCPDLDFIKFWNKLKGKKQFSDTKE